MPSAKIGHAVQPMKPGSLTYRPQKNRAKRPPLIAAMIAMLPPEGQSWTTDQQNSWLRMMATAFEAVYGGGRVTPMAVRESTMREPAKPKPPRHAFFIDFDGVAKNGKGERILPKDVAGTIFDLRGIDGDMKTIVWADDSRGLNGHDLTISAA